MPEMPDLRDLIQQLADAAPLLASQAARAAEYADCGGYDSPYPQFLNEISHCIGALKKAHAEVSAMAKHTHEWDPQTDYCVICHADGRA